MSTVTLQPKLMEELEQVAAGRAVMPEELLETAVRAYLRQIEREKIIKEAEAFRSMHAELVKRHLGQYVAIHNGKVLDHDEDFQTLHKRIRQRHGRQAVLLRRVEAEPERVLVFRSPQFEGSYLFNAPCCGSCRPTTRNSTARCGSMSTF